MTWYDMIWYDVIYAMLWYIHFYLKNVTPLLLNNVLIIPQALFNCWLPPFKYHISLLYLYFNTYVSSLHVFFSHSRMVDGEARNNGRYKPMVVKLLDTECNQCYSDTEIHQSPIAVRNIRVYQSTLTEVSETNIACRTWISNTIHIDTKGWNYSTIFSCGLTMRKYFDFTLSHGCNYLSLP